MTATSPETADTDGAEAGTMSDRADRGPVVADRPEAGPSGDGGPHPAAPAEAGRRRPHPARWVALAVGLVVALLVGMLATRPPAANVIAPSPIVGREAPEISGPDLDRTPARLSQLRGRYVIVNFFATWCIPCVREHPELLRFAARHPAEEAQVFMVVYDDQPEAVRAFFAKRGRDWPVVDDPGSKVDFGVRGVPESFLIDPDGVVLSRLVGGVTADGLDDLLRRAKAAAARTP